MSPVRHTQAISGILLVTGTCIGAGMLALPVVTGLAGFLPAIAINILCCLFMITTGLLLVEAILWSEEGANILSLSNKFLGTWGKILAGGAFLFYYYCLEVSYCAGGTPTLTQVLSSTFGITLSSPWNYILFATIFGAFVFVGTRAVDRLNWLLMTGLVISFFLLVGIGSREVSIKLLERTDWRYSLAAAPTLFGAYASHNLLPSLSTYLKRNINHLRTSVIIGTLIPFIVYGVWQWMIIGTLPYDDILAAEARGEPITQTLQGTVGHPYLSLFGEFFGFFALTTSFLGVSLSMVDFIGDGTGIKREGWGRLFAMHPRLCASRDPCGSLSGNLY